MRGVLRSLHGQTRRCFWVVTGFFVLSVGMVAGLGLPSRLEAGAKTAEKPAEPVLVAGAKTGDKPAEPVLVTAQALSGRTVAEPGVAVPLGIQLTIAPGWHIYWLHPGDAGMSTQVEWKPVSGAQVTGVRWPAPTRFITYETIHANGYEGEVILPATLTAATSKRKAVTVSGVVRWLACKGECIKGSTPFSLSLPTTGKGEETSSAAPIAAAEARVPRALDSADPFQLVMHAPELAAPDSSVPFEVEVSPTAPEVQVRLEALFLNALPGQAVAHEERLSETRVRVQTTLYEPIPPGARLAEGVAQVQVTRAGTVFTRYVALSFPTRMGSPPGHPPAH